MKRLRNVNIISHDDSDQQSTSSPLVTIKTENIQLESARGDLSQDDDDTNVLTSRFTI